MKSYTEQLEDIVNSAKKIITEALNKNGELIFTHPKTLTFVGGGWNTSEYINKEQLEILSADFICGLADEIRGLTC